MSHFKTPPLSRHEALAPLSRDHYAALVQAQHLIKAAKADDVSRRKFTAEFVDAWDALIHPHLEDEERLLLPWLDESQKERLLSEHAQLRTMASQMRAQRRNVAPDADVLAAVGNRLNDHIRWEERELFEQLQQSLSVHAMAQLQAQTQHMDEARQRNFNRGSAADDAADAAHGKGKRAS